ncbi:MAG: glycosyltransferase family 2 protein [Candidatus Riflebacteria bacterium]|nr:glycosyltransferase family 2 protein [Candidatus Riflebacteria bacterium]
MNVQPKSLYNATIRLAGFQPQIKISTKAGPSMIQITVVVAALNAKITLPRCLGSIWQQSFGNFELIVIDGSSADGTLDYLKSVTEKIDILISEPDTGVYNAWNKAIRLAKGEWICFVGADDEFASPLVLEKVASVLKTKVRGEKYVYGSINVVNRRGAILDKLGEPWEKVRENFKSIHCVPHTGSFHHRSLFEDGGFDESFKIAADYEFLLRYLKNGEALFIDDLITVNMRVGGMSSRPENSFINLFENRRALQKHGLAGFFPSKIWIGRFLRVCLRVFLARVLDKTKQAKLLDLGRKLLGKPPYWEKLDE